MKGKISPKGDTSIVSILFAGVGGQGVILSSEILSRAAMFSGFDVKKTEVHGVAQRGGTVVSHVRYGEAVRSPLVPAGRADVLVALEKLEGIRYSYYLREGAAVLLNDEEIVPTRYIGEKLPYPEDIEGTLSSWGYELRVIDARALAAGAGSSRAFNVAVLGALSNFLDLPHGSWRKAIMEVLPERFHELNLKAFEAGRVATAGAK